MNTQKGVALILLILLGLILIGGGVYFYIQNNSKEAIKNPQKFILSGTWKFEEASKESNVNGITTPAWEYTLSIDNEDETRGMLSIDGYQALVRLNVSIEKLNDSANVIFDSYAKDNIGEIYKKGDILFTISPDSEGRLEINWYKMQPNVEESKINAIFVRQEETYSTKDATNIEQFCKTPEEKVPGIEVVSKSPFQVKVTKNTGSYEYAPSVLARNEPVQVSKDNKNIVFEIDNTNGIDGSCSYTDSTCTKNIYIINNGVESTQNPRLLYASKNGIEKWIYDSVNNLLYVKENDYNQVIEFTKTSEFFTKIDVLTGATAYSKKIVSNNDISSISDLTILSNGDIAELEVSGGSHAYDNLNYRITRAIDGTVQRIKLENLSDPGGIGSPVLSVDGKYVALTDGWLSEKGVKVLNVQQKSIEFQDSSMTDIVFLNWITPNIISLSNNEEILKLLDVKNKTVIMCKK